MYQNKKIFLVIPCFNEEEGLRKILPDVPSVVDEVIVVDNNSTDRTGQVAVDLGAKVIFEPRQGYGRAIWSGVLESQGDIVVIGDGDGTYPVEAISRLVQEFVDNNLGAVWGNRFDPHFNHEMPFLNRFGNFGLSLVFSILVGRRIVDALSGMMVFSRDFLQNFKPKSGDMPFSSEIKMAAVLTPGLKWREIGINYFQRVGRSKLKMWRAGFAILIFLFYKRFFH